MRDDDPDSLDVEGPLGWKATAKGPTTMIALLICVCFGGIMFFGYMHHVAQAVAASEATQQHARIEDKFNEIIYVLSLSQTDREKLNITMPESLRGKTRRHHKDEEP